LVGLLRQAVFGWLAGHDDVNDAERLRHDPATDIDFLVTLAGQT
jgi:hypothetical protein